MKQFNWQEMKEFWRIHGSTWSARNDFEKDPLGLNVVVYPGASTWLNDYFAFFQKKIYVELLRHVQPECPGGSALDVGCGAGRWCRVLKDNGYDKVTGLDLQPQLVTKDREMHPDIRFECGAIQDFSPDRLFDLVSSVTVLQHLPYDQQAVAVRKLRELTKTNGYAVILENIKEKGPHVFSNSIPQWLKIFQDAGFKAVSIRRYDYSPCFRFHAWAVRTLSGGLGLRTETNKDLSPADFAFIPRGKKSFVHRVSDGVRDLAITADWRVESLLVPLNFGISSLHCGFLFQAV